jgi:hypothetical protein
MGRQSFPMLFISYGNRTDGSYCGRCQYVSNNPISFIDPDGRDPACITGADFCVTVAESSRSNFGPGSVWSDSFYEPVAGFTNGDAPGSSLPGYGSWDGIPSIPTLSGADTERQSLFTEVFKEVLKRLGNSKCASFLSSKGIDVMNALYKTNFSYEYIPDITFESQATNSTLILVSSSQIDAVYNGKTDTIKINNNGNFFGSLGRSGLAYQTGLSSTNLRAFILLHELGHATDVLKDDSFNTNGQQDANNKTIMENCFPGKAYRSGSNGRGI